MNATGLFSEDTARKVRQYLLTRGETIELFGGTERIEGMSLRELTKAVLDTASPEDIKALNHAILGPMLRRANNPPVTDASVERAENIRRANEDFNVVAVANLPSGVPDDEKPFKDLERPKEYPSISQMLDAVVAWVTREGPPLLTISGAVGVGKTSILVAAGNRLLGRGEIVVYRRESDLASDLQVHIRTKDVDRQLTEYAQTPWLMIDDVGTTAQGDWMRGQMDDLIDTRWRLAAGGTIRTLVATNLFSSDLPDRIASRLGDTSRGRAVKVDAPDYRRGGWRLHEPYGEKEGERDT